jgi:hypothetical protein
MSMADPLHRVSELCRVTHHANPKEIPDPTTIHASLEHSGTRDTDKMMQFSRTTRSARLILPLEAQSTLFVRIVCICGREAACGAGFSNVLVFFVVRVKQ